MLPAQFRASERLSRHSISFSIRSLWANESSIVALTNFPTCYFERVWKASPVLHETAYTVKQIMRYRENGVSLGSIPNGLKFNRSSEKICKILVAFKLLNLPRRSWFNLNACIWFILWEQIWQWHLFHRLLVGFCEGRSSCMFQFLEL